MRVKVLTQAGGESRRRLPPMMVMVVEIMNSSYAVLIESFIEFRKQIDEWGGSYSWGRWVGMWG